MSPLAVPALATVGLSPAKRVQLALEIVVSYLHVRRALRARPLPQLVATIRDEDPCKASDEDLSKALLGQRLGRAVVRTLRLVPTDTRCLMRSLVLMRMLARRGIPVLLVIGVRSEPSFEAHAWTEISGTPLLDPGAAEFQRLLEV